MEFSCLHCFGLVIEDFLRGEFICTECGIVQSPIFIASTHESNYEPFLQPRLIQESFWQPYFREDESDLPLLPLPPNYDQSMVR